MYHVSAQGIDERMINVHYYHYHHHHYYYYTGSYRIRRWRRCLQYLNDNHAVCRTGRFSGEAAEDWSRQRTALDGLLPFPHLLAEVGRHWHWHWHWHWHMAYCEGHRPIHKEGIGGWGVGKGVNVFYTSALSSTIWWTMYIVLHTVAISHCIAMSIRYNHILTSSQVGRQDCGSGHRAGCGLRHLHEPNPALLFGAPLRLLARATRRPAGHRLW